MTPRQKRVVAILAVLDVVIILGLVALFARSGDANTSPTVARTLQPGADASAVLTEPSHEKDTPEGTFPAQSQPTPKAPQGGTAASVAPAREACQLETARLLAWAGLGGTVVLAPDGALSFEIIHSLEPGETVDEVAQLVWLAFDVATILQERPVNCGAFATVEVTILAVQPDARDQADTRIEAVATAADLAAFAAGELSQDAFVERVAFSTASLP